MDERELKTATEDYWDIAQNKDDLEEQLKLYLDGDDALFAKEIEWLKQKENSLTPTKQQRLPKDGCKTLVCLVGFSIEPILQTIWAYKPSERIILLLNQMYIDDYGEDFGETVKGCIELLYKAHLSDCPQPPIKLEVLEDKTLPVFDKLRTFVRKSQNVVIDITGSKKKMISEAFLYAAYADIDVSYVDFDDDKYHVKWRRPYGFACQIGRLQNPYQAFALRDWEQVKNLYKNYNFRAAKTALDTLQTNLTKAGFDDYLQAIQQEAIPRAKTMLSCYEAWENGNFNQAKIAFENISWDLNLDRPGSKFPPTAITQFGGKWFHYNVQEHRFDNAPEDFYANVDSLCNYIYDELKRIRRIEKNEDYRSLFLRAAGLNEVIASGRLVQLVNSSDKQLALSKAFVKNNSPTIKVLFKVLLGLKGKNLSIGDKNSGCTIEIYNFPQEINIYLSAPMNRWWENQTQFFAGARDWEKFLHIRNKLTHAYFSVSQELAKEALAFVVANFEDFLQVYEQTTISDLQKTKTLIAIRLSWHDFCMSCGLNEHLPYKLLE